MTITAQRHQDNIHNNFVNQLHVEKLQNGYQHDEATAHTTSAVMKYLREFYDDRLISLHSHLEYPPKSPDLTTLDSRNFMKCF
ncbi:hypothetical protein BDFB_013984 [Asbolus verrucosus]|uniref:DDE 3 domain containing protein n=1 Tax=Asbolus verrucosus TaxID=1661398 RepID=A0A482VFS2_ASBVE|nr:hypothetical protein BDFB_013984 [Asbolus verrucosus]